MPINVIVKEIIQEFNITNFVETGIFKCDTTKIIFNHFKTSNIENFTMWEVDNHRPYVIAGRKNFPDKRINFIESDSVKFIHDYIENGVLSNSKTLFFLDAHVHLSIGSNVLYQEVEELMKLKNNPIIWIDDFSNPLNSTHAGMSQHGKPLDVDYIRPLLHNRTDILYYPIDCREGDCIGQGIVFLDEYDRTLKDRLKNIRVQGSKL